MSGVFWGNEHLDVEENSKKNNNNIMYIYISDSQTTGRCNKH